MLENNISSCFSYAYMGISSTWEVWRARESTQEVRITRGDSCASFVLSKLPTCSIPRQKHADAILNFKVHFVYFFQLIAITQYGTLGTLAKKLIPCKCQNHSFVTNKHVALY